MKYDLKRQYLCKDLATIVWRQCTKKDLDLHRMSSKSQKELKRILKAMDQSVIPSHLVCKKLKRNIGHGIFLHPETKPILKGEVIGPYSGEVHIVPENRIDETDYAFDLVNRLRLSREEQNLFDPERPYHPRRLYALQLDAAKKGNFTRFINHSDRPNVEARLVSSKGHPLEIIYFAKKKILPGEQLLVDYEGEDQSYWKPLGIKPFPMTPKTFKLDANLRIV